MNGKRVICLSVILTLGASVFLWGNHEVQRTYVSSFPVSHRQPASIQKTKTSIIKAKTELEQSGLSAEKIDALNRLQEFHSSHPAFNSENILKRKLLLEIFLQNAEGTVNAFSKLMQISKDDSLKSFLLNLTMNSELNDSDKADIFLARLKAGAEFSESGLVPDHQMSFMIGISHLSRLEDEVAKKKALEQLKNESTFADNAAFRGVLRDYFHESI